MDLFPLPVTLAVENNVKKGDVLNLVDNTNYLLATLTVDDLWEPDLENELN